MATGYSDDSTSDQEDINQGPGDRWMSHILIDEEGGDKIELVENSAEPTNNEIQVMEEDNIISRPIKRGREEDDEGSWTKVVRDKEKKHKQFKKEVFIWSKEKLPKQFAIAKLFNSIGLTEINHVKYINSYKLRIEVSTEECVNKLLDCQEFQTKGWKVYSATDVNTSYGVIRNVDLELKEDEILTAIKCPSNIQIISVKRLHRRHESGWVPSEVVRIGFSGSHLPSFIYIDCLRTKVDPFVFPVTQCSKCWKFGHIKTRCPSNKIVCPKCTEQHSNCEVNKFKCVNCRGDHMALNRNCPVYAREKRVRELMAEYNCSYYVACNMYVKPQLPLDSQTMGQNEKPKIDPNNSFNGLNIEESGSSYKYTTDLFPPLFTPKRASSPQVSKQKKSHLYNKNESVWYGHRESSDNIPKQPTTTDKDASDNVNNTREVHFDELINRLKDIIFMRNYSINEKFYEIIKCCSKWLVLVFVDRISEWPIVNKCLELFLGLNK
ncbi:unnamed protein product [Spodoptera littoralis]|uniref:CCHC-type domain-containing protein n=1 Tax=Spodoptera littoralis TaxID=7109 RepID=A0A9P0N983_SPOLI|nr:unnamed protein product [Spodoptera littoralis]